ncbi:MAG: tryptophan 2,3-dioxygenase family protein [Thermoanaerobaculia bacterium]|nr:tryptophan 2,3-dioxygenase family protein [Thermoanaerobaculia bacterium]
MPVSREKALTYSSYLEIDRLLELQRPLSPGPEHDELLFIVIHQVYELWFKEVNHEIAHLQRTLEVGETPDALATFRRILTILKTLVAQVDVLETMTPVSFASFRDRLESASGFQSAQFREMEFRLGQKREKLLEHHPPGTPGRRRLEEVYESPSLYASFLRFLARSYDIPAELLERDPRLPPPESARVREVLLQVYRTDHLSRSVCERMVDLDEGLQEWRYRHVKMVERTIGWKRGTGGSEGAAYLRATLFRPLFPDLWEIRADL